MYLVCTASVGRMRIDGRTRLNITNTEGDLYPKQRSLILDSRSGQFSIHFCIYFSYHSFKNKISNTFVLYKLKFFVFMFLFTGAYSSHAKFYSSKSYGVVLFMIIINLFIFQHSGWISSFDLKWSFVSFFLCLFSV
jgi:hypothetical protein